MICCKVNPNLTSKDSDSFATGRSSVLYVASKLFSKRFSWGPCKLSLIHITSRQSTIKYKSITKYMVEVDGASAATFITYQLIQILKIFTHIFHSISSVLNFEQFEYIFL
uniref:(northern house mosquito) hypothetical protein n=1 Tax=Culex pipiens TaxID=7175 RepID=A0A8D8A3L4_CULPI